MVKLTSKNFYDIYAISLVLFKIFDDKILNQLAEVANEIAEKYYEIVQSAVRAELMHARYGAPKEYSTINDRDIKHNESVLSSVGVNPLNLYSRDEREKITLDSAEKIFDKCIWSRGAYGGKSWADIAKTGNVLKNLLPINRENLALAITILDHINDLVHNNDVFLMPYVNFDLKDALDAKEYCEPEEIISKASKEVKEICRIFYDNIPFI